MNHRVQGRRNVWGHKDWSSPCFQDFRWDFFVYFYIWELRARLINDLQKLLLKSILIISSFCNHVTFDLTTWSRQIGPKCSIKSANMPLLLGNFASKNSLNTQFKVNAQAKINLTSGIFVLFLLRIWVQFVYFIFVCFMVQKCTEVKAYFR